jgi:hypothetical protein
MRKLTTHVANPLNDKLDIEVLDEPGAGGACHEYLIHLPIDIKHGVRQTLINFQNGPIAENGINGVTHEALLAILIDRLECFQDGAFACHENAEALSHLQEAMDWLHSRTRERMSRGVEGKTQQ